jgi:TatD DNase family protein
MAVFYDTHAHLDFPDFARDLPQVLERAQAAGVERIIGVGTDETSSRRAIQLSEQYPNLFAAVGWHPNHVREAPADVRPALSELARHPRVVAIGETGLDFHRLPSKEQGGTPAQDDLSKRRQTEIFQQQLDVAAALGLNVIIHQRGEVLEPTLDLMRHYSGQVRGVFHCFAGDAATLERVLELGSLVSFTGILTFKSGQSVRDALAAAPPDKFMLETDCPFLAPAPYRGKRCEPAYVKEIAVAAAQVRGCSLEELGRDTCATAHHFFPKAFLD